MWKAISDGKQSTASAFRLLLVLDLKEVSGQAKVQRAPKNVMYMVALRVLTSISGLGPGRHFYLLVQI